MADKDATASQAKAAASAAAEAPKGNPVFRMMGLPNLPKKLPSRNWMIFWTVIGSWTAAVVYDRQQKKRIQRKWCNLVSDLAREPLPPNTLPRKVNVYLSAPPGDSLIPAREHFAEYVKPILVAAALDWDAVEGRKEGDIRAGLAERIRKLRKILGEQHQDPIEAEDGDADLIIDMLRDKAGIQHVPGVEGDLVIGRHTWKEYIRGLHEGWLGPLDNPHPPPAPEEPTSTPQPESPAAESTTASESETSDDASPAPITTADVKPDEPKPEDPPKESEEEKKPKKRKQPLPFNKTADYSESHLPASCPNEFPPTIAIQLPHLLGFLKTPIRMYRFLNRRAVADDVGRQAAAAVFAIYRPYESPSQTQLSLGASPSLDPSNQTNDVEAGSWEQKLLLTKEEPDWQKSIRKEAAEGGELNKEGRERIWTQEIVMDERIAERMRRFELSQDLEQRAKEVEKNLRPWYWFGFGEKNAHSSSEEE